MAPECRSFCIHLKIYMCKSVCCVCMCAHHLLDGEVSYPQPCCHHNQTKSLSISVLLSHLIAAVAQLQIINALSLAEREIIMNEEMKCRADGRQRVCIAISSLLLNSISTHQQPTSLLSVDCQNLQNFKYYSNEFGKSNVFTSHVQQSH